MHPSCIVFSTYMVISYHLNKPIVILPTNTDCRINSDWKIKIKSTIIQIHNLNSNVHKLRLLASTLYEF